MPDLSGKNDGGPVGAAAQRAARAPGPVGAPGGVPAARGRVIIVSGPSGAGKGTLIEAILPRFPRLEVAVSATTRPRRQGEVDGREYHFLAPDEFERRVSAGQFLEHVAYAGNRYGTLAEEVERRVAAGRSVVLEIELEGARAVRARLPEAIAIFIAPPSMDELARRLRDRGTEDEEDIARRLAVGRNEIEAMAEFDVVIVNDDVDRAADELAGAVERATRARERDEASAERSAADAERRTAS